MGRQAGQVSRNRARNHARLVIIINHKKTTKKEVLKMEKKVCSVAEVAQMLGLNMHTTYELVRSDGFPALRVGKNG